MGVELNHTIVQVRDKRESAQFLATILGLGEPQPFGPFLAVQTGNNVSLDFADDHGPVSPQHYAFLVSESDFDQIFGRIRDRQRRVFRTALGNRLRPAQRAVVVDVIADNRLGGEC